MNVWPILSALRRNPMGAILIVLQIALTVAIVCNALFIVQQQTRLISRPSGVDEASLFSFYNLWGSNTTDYKSRVQVDLSALRALPDVEDAIATTGLPLRGGGYHYPVAISPVQTKDNPEASVYLTDQHGLNALGLQLAAGRWFHSDEIHDMDSDHDNPESAPMAVLTDALAQRLFPQGNALGKAIYLGKSPATVVGIVKRMQAARISTSSQTAEYAVLVPFLWEAPASLYVVRAKPGRRDAAIQAAQLALSQISRSRSIANVQGFDETRSEAYRPYRATAIILACVGLLLISVTGLGIVGLTSYWVSQRKRQIGIRRALGARRIDILHYFHTENLLVVGCGAIIGVILANLANTMIVEHFEMDRLPQIYIVAGAVIVLGLGQLSVLWPAWRAARISPAVATQAN
ncbi:ABC transporter permease [Dyella choica]|uniref:FtsX-like permease family protein n=1 Tax=Dyella choica TaxID=1927959 RepID=A0A432LZL3_9GAMM|nr:FtsX-like permease family protein [Dyella choica]RUL69268.1 FtsX-like permease family protein [Dyella choica]